MTIATLPSPFWSNLRSMRSDPVRMFARGTALRTDVVRIPFGMFTVFAAYTPEAVSAVLVSGGEITWKGTRGAQLLRRVLGPGLLTTEGDAWKARRKIAQPSFRRETISALVPRIAKHADATGIAWAAATGVVDVHAATNQLALRIVCDVLFSMDIGDRMAIVERALDTILGGFLWMVTSPIPRIDQWPLPSTRRHHAALAELRGVVDSVIADRRASGEVRDDLLGAWLAAHATGALSDDDLRAEVVTMLLAGHETTANAMAWTLGLLGSHPEALDTVLAEIDTSDPTDARALKQLDAAIRESLRLFPPVWIVARATRGELAIPGAAVPSNSFVFVPIAAIHRDPRWWTDPDSYRPQRWIAPHTWPTHAFMPFGAGQRKCIGEHFAMLETNVALAVILKRVRPKLADGETLDAQASVTLRPRNGLKMTFTRRASAEV